MIKKLKLTFSFLLFSFILACNISNIFEKTEIVSLNSYEVTDEKYFTFSNYDDVNRTVSIAHNTLDVDHEHGSTLVLPSTHINNGITYDVTSIATAGFYECDELEVLVLSSSIINIESYAFTSCTNLSIIIFDNNSSLEEIESSAFDGCSSLETLLLPEGLKTIGMSAFRNCSSLEVLYLPSTVMSVGLGSFTSTSNLQSIYINSEIIFSNSNVFDSSSCPIIVSDDCINFYTDSNLNRYEDITYVVEIEIDFNGGSNATLTEASVYKLFGLEFGYAVNQTTGIWTYESNDKFTDLPTGLTKFEYNQELRLSEYTFDGEKIHSEVLVSQELIELGLIAQYEGVFQTVYDEVNNTHVITGISDCFKGSILNLNVSSTYYDGTNLGDVTSIAANAFEGMTFTNITFEEGLTSIGDDAFKDVKLTNSSVIVIPNSVSFIGTTAFSSLSGVGYIYLNDEADYGTTPFDNVSALIIASSEEVYNEIESNINNTNLTYLVYITLDFNDGSYENCNNLVLTRLNNEALRYIQKDDLTWYESDGYVLPTPSKDDCIFTMYVLNTNTYSLISEDSTFITNTTLTASYNLQVIKSQASDTTISGSLHFVNGVDINTTLSIELNNNSSLSSDVKNLDIYGIYSIKLLLNGESYNPNLSSYKLSILLPDDMGEVVKYTIYMMEDNVLKEIIGDYINGYIEFEITSLGDIALLNQSVIVSVPTVSESLLTAILIMALVNILEFVFIFQLNKGKRRTIIASCNILPLVVLSFVSNVSLSILITLSATAIAQGIYILHLYLTRNNTIQIKQQVESIVSSVSLEELEDIISESRKSIEELNDEYLSQEEFREMLSLDDDEDEEIIDNNEDESEEEEDELQERLSLNGQMVVVRFKKSFSARLNLTQDINKDYHTIIKNKLLSYKKVNCRISWNHEAYNFGRNQAAKVNVRGKTLFVYLPLNPIDYLNSKIAFKDCSYIKKYEQLPFRLKIKSKKSVKNALELIELVMSNFNTTEKRKFEPINYYQKNRGFEKLLQEELIKEVITAKEYNELKELNKVIEDDNKVSSGIKLTDEFESKRRNVMVRRTIFIEEDNKVVSRNVMVRRNNEEATEYPNLIVKTRPLVKPKRSFESTVEQPRKPLVRSKEAQTINITSPFKLFEEKQEKLRIKALENMNKKNV